MPKNLHDADNVLLTGIQRFYVENKLFDVKVSWKNIVLFKCHKIVLAAFSNYFETLLEGTSGCAILSLDAVKDIYVEQLQNIVKFMYGRNIVAKRRDCRQLLEAAKIFGVTALSKLLELQLAKPSSVNDEETLTFKSFAVGSLLLVNFQRYRDDSKFIDVEISCQNRALFSCHKLILASFSSYFESLLIKTEGCAILNLDAVDVLYVAQLEDLLNFMYGRQISVEQTDLELLKDAAKVFGIHSVDRITTVQKRKRSKKSDPINSAANDKFGLSSGKKYDASSNVDYDHHAYVCEGNAAAAFVQQLGNSLSSSLSSPCTVIEAQQPSTSTNIEIPMYSSKTMKKQLPSNNSSFTNEEPSKFDGKIFKSGTNSFKLHLKQNCNQQQINISAIPMQEQQPLAYVCAECKQVFTDEDKLLEHNLVHLPKKVSQEFGETHQRAIITDNNLEHYNSNNISPSADANFECALCSEQLPDRPSLNNHYETKHKLVIYNCDLCSKSFKSELGFKNHRETHKSIVLKCDLCDFRTKTKTYLNLHMIKYHETTLNGRCKRKKFACSQCGLTFIFDSLLKRHYQSKHLKLKPYQCSYCDYTATEKAAVKLHVRSMHTLIKPYACNTCNYRSTNSSALAKHKRRHTGEKPYCCDLCESCFTEKRDLDVHKMKDHERIRPFECTQCDVKFYRKDFLLAHVRTIHGVGKQQTMARK